MRNILFGITLIISSLGHCLNLSQINIGKNQTGMIQNKHSTLELNSYDFFINKKSVGTVFSIGSDSPLPNEIKKLNSFLTLIKYDAGSAGTSTIMQMDRVVVLFSDPKNSLNWQIIGDHAISLKRFQGLQQMLELERGWKWNESKMTLTFESFDEEPHVTYSWNSKTNKYKKSIRK